MVQVAGSRLTNGVFCYIKSPKHSYNKKKKKLPRSKSPQMDHSRMKPSSERNFSQKVSLDYDSKESFAIYVITSSSLH